MLSLKTVFISLLVLKLVGLNLYFIHLFLHSRKIHKIKVIIYIEKCSAILAGCLGIIQNDYSIIFSKYSFLKDESNLNGFM